MPSRRSERGVSLVIVMVMIATFGIMVTAVGTQAQSGSLSNAGVRKQRINYYAASGAIAGAIAYLRGDRTRGRVGVSCPTVTMGSSQGTVSVACTPVAGSGTVQEGVSSPGYALLTTAGLPGGYPSGVGVTQSKNNTFKVNGPVFSNSTIDVNAMDAQPNSVGAFGACSGPIPAVRSESTLWPRTCGPHRSPPHRPRRQPPRATASTRSRRCCPARTSTLTR
jgi:hypothetical protein